MRIAFTTLGCKINQYETDAMRRDLLSKGNTVVPFDAEADVYIINTCSVTAKSDYQCRQAIRSAGRRGKDATVVVTGCYAETRPDEIKKIPGVTMVFGNRDKAVIADRITSQAATADSKAPAVSARRLITMRNKTRGFLKIQDGCDNRCSYCIVPLARGASRSAAPEDVQREFERMVEEGYPEIVLTGIHIGSYGSDLGKGVTLTDLIKDLVSIRGKTRVRMSSIEPREITQGLVDFLGSGLCRHLHVPLQSGDDTILRSMKRNYSADFYLELLDSIAQKVPGIALGADVMVGFPGEGVKEFQNTLRIIERSPLTHLHVFSYSPRPGTPAAELKDQVPIMTKKERSEAVRRLAYKKNEIFVRNHIGNELNVVVEDKKDVQTGLLTGLTDNYIRLHIYGASSEHIGKEITVRIKNTEKLANFAVIL